MQKTALTAAAARGSVKLYAETPVRWIAWKPLLIKMKLTVLFLTLAFCQVYAAGTAQTITLSGKNIPLRSVFSHVESQTGFNVFANRDMMDKAHNITVSVSAMPLNQFMELVLTGLPIGFRIDGRDIILFLKPEETSKPGPLQAIVLATRVQVSGSVRNAQGEILSGVSVVLKGSKSGVSTNASGQFTLGAIEENSVLQVSMVGFETIEIGFRRTTGGFTAYLLKKQESVLGTALNDGVLFLHITLAAAHNALDEVVINKGYYSESKRNATGNVAVVTAEEIQRQPVANVLNALHGRVTGMVITQGNGVSGSSVSVQVRGLNSLLQGSNPLFIIDGVPMATNLYLNQMISAAGNTANHRVSKGNANPSADIGISPLASLNPGDIESIQVLKDADATAIYGSRGANGVVLITTKKGKPGKTTVNAMLQTGWSKAARLPELLNRRDYIDMRKEAFQNDGIDMDVSNAYDLMVYDTTRYTDLQKEFLGGTARTNTAQVSVSGGARSTSFTIGGAHHQESTVFPSTLGYKRSSFHAGITHRSPQEKLLLTFSANYSADNNRQSNIDMTAATINPPTLPALKDEEGALVWYKDGTNFYNPFAILRQPYIARTNNLSANLQVTYNILRELSVKVNAGHNSVGFEENQQFPLNAINPEYRTPTTGGSAQFGSNNFKSYIIEPQVHYRRAIGSGKLEALAGFTWQYTRQNGHTINGGGYANDEQLGSLAAAASITGKTSTNELYKYAAVFGRINYNFDRRYIINITGRRDGSSRFGSGNQFANFSAAGLAWIFSEETFMKNVDFISFAKIRSSYGTTGNDQIGNYKYLNTWNSGNSAIVPYQGSPMLMPTALFNADYQWEINRKLEAAIDLELFDGKLLTTVSWFRNRSSNQLTQYRLPATTGFAGITRNLDAIVENSGVEIELTGRQVQLENFSWSTSFNITFQRNKLISFPNLANSSYAQTYEIGKPVTSIRGYEYLGVDPQTGLYQFNDKSGNGTLGTEDYVSFGDFTPRYFGGLRNNITYRNFQLEFFFEFRKHTAMSPAAQMYYQENVLPGGINNISYLLNDRWRKPGDQATYQRLTTDPGTPAGKMGNQYFYSSAAYMDATYARLKNLSLSYNIPAKLADKWRLSLCRFFVQAQNLLTLTSYPGDPESTGYLMLPPLRTITVGVQVNIY